MLTVYGRDTSSNVQIVMWAAAELGLDVDRRDYGLNFGGNDTPEYLAMNPNGLIPTMKDGDLTLWESAAILRYLAARYGEEPFWPRDPVVRAPLDMWAEWVRTTFGPTYNGRVFFPSVRVPPSKQDRDAIARGVEATKKVALMLDDRLGDGPWLAGADFTYADIMTGNLLYRYFEHEFDRADAPRLRAYYDRLRERPAYAEHNCISFEALRARDA